MTCDVKFIKPGDKEYPQYMSMLPNADKIDVMSVDGAFVVPLLQVIDALEQKPKTGHCKDCKWWKDSDGAYRRGIGAESQCPMNRKEVYEGNGYCFLFEPPESEE